MSRFEQTRSAAVGPATRPVAIPDDVDVVGAADKAHGVIELPAHVRWSGPRRLYNLDDRRERALVYEQVMTEGTDDDVRRFIDIDQLVELWPDLVLPRHVYTAWANWLETQRCISVGR